MTVERKQIKIGPYKILGSNKCRIELKIWHKRVYIPGAGAGEGDTEKKKNLITNINLERNEIYLQQSVKKKTL